jgi:hypothetical protein
MNRMREAAQFALALAKPVPGQPFRAAVTAER